MEGLNPKLIRSKLGAYVQQPAAGAKNAKADKKGETAPPAAEEAVAKS